MNITVEEHLIVFARIHGRSEAQSRRVAQACMAKLGIQEYAQFRAKALSGGNEPNVQFYREWSSLAFCRNPAQAFPGLGACQRPFSLYAGRGIDRP